VASKQFPNDCENLQTNLEARLAAALSGPMRRGSTAIDRQVTGIHKITREGGWRTSTRVLEKLSD
jgi:hypothetical protein